MSPLICSATSSFCKKNWVLLVKHYRIILLFFCPWCPLVVAFFLQVSVSSLFVQFHLSCFILPFQPQNMIQTFCCLHIFNFSFILKQFASVLFNSIIQKHNSQIPFLHISLPISIWSLLAPSLLSCHLYSNIFFAATLNSITPWSLIPRYISQWGIIIGCNPNDINYHIISQ